MVHEKLFTVCGNETRRVPVASGTPLRGSKTREEVMGAGPGYRQRGNELSGIQERV